MHSDYDCDNVIYITHNVRRLPMKKIMSLVLLIVFVLSACAKTPQIYHDGTFEGVGEGKKGPVAVSVTFMNDEITKVKSQLMKKRRISHKLFWMHYLHKSLNVKARMTLMFSLVRVIHAMRSSQLLNRRWRMLELMTKFEWITRWIKHQECLVLFCVGVPMLDQLIFDIKQELK